MWHQQCNVTTRNDVKRTSEKGRERFFERSTLNVMLGPKFLLNHHPKNQNQWFCRCMLIFNYLWFSKDYCRNLILHDGFMKELIVRSKCEAAWYLTDIGRVKEFEKKVSLDSISFHDCNGDMKNTAKSLCLYFPVYEFLTDKNFHQFSLIKLDIKIT